MENEHRKKTAGPNILVTLEQDGRLLHSLYPFLYPFAVLPLGRPREQLIWTGEVLRLGLWLEEVSDSYRFLLSSIYGVLMIF